MDLVGQALNQRYKFGDTFVTELPKINKKEIKISKEINTRSQRYKLFIEVLRQFP